MTLADAQEPMSTEPGERPATLQTPILVLRRSMGPLQHTALAVARSAGRIGVPVYTVREDEDEAALRSRYLTGSIELQDGDDARWLESLMGVGDELDGAILLPVDDMAAVTVAEHQVLLTERFRLRVPPAEVARRLASKLELARLCAELDVPTPQIRVPGSAAEARAAGAEFGYPVVLKRIGTWAPAGPAAPSVAVVGDERTLIERYEQMQDPAGGNVLLQEYIPGASDSVWMLNGYFDAASRCLCAFTARKLRQSMRGNGPTTLGECQRNETVVALAQRLLTAVGYRGIVDMGFRFDARDGMYKLLDVNPRLGSTFRLFVGTNDLDVVRAMHLDLRRQPVPEAHAVDGRRWLDEPLDLASAWWMIRSRSLSVQGWLRSMRGLQEGAWWAADDPAPFLALAARLPHIVLARRRQRRAVIADRGRR